MEILKDSSSYDVFLSFRGVDTRLSFVDHLHNALLEANLKTFLDDDEIETGEDLRPELEWAIKSSRSSIIVLSTNYASSTWCLDELVLILEQRLTADQLVIPIFYHVEPTHVRKQERSFGVAMAVHRQRMEAEVDTEKRSLLAKKIDRWNKALIEVAQLKGMDAKGRKETEFIGEIVRNIHRRLAGSLQCTLPLLFGMEDSIEFITSWLKDGSSHNADILTILGMGGIGKTSLARYVHGSHYRLFAKSSFIECVGEKCATLNGLSDLQKQLFGDISKTNQIQVNNSLAYTSMIENGLTRKKVFIVLDNIDTVDQLYALLGKKGFYPGSKIIITTKDASLIEKYAPINLLVKPKHTKLLLKGLHKEAALRLLSHHAFMSNCPNDGYEDVSKQLMAYCKGHPLALKVLGESLCNKTVAEWEGYIIGLKKETDSHIMNALKVSLDSMQSNNDKELFKHIACFFVQKDKVFAETILESCGIRTTGIRNLIDRCLLTIDQDNILMMHQLIQEMGRDVVRRESPNRTEERSRLWCYEESFNVLEENKGTRNIKGLVLDMKMLEREMLCGSVELETSALSKMPSLMLLELNFVQLSGCYRNFPKKIRWLCMHGFPLKSIPLDLPMENLVALDMSYSNIEYFDMSYSNPQPPAKRQKVTYSCSTDKRLLGSLKFLTLSFSEHLSRIGGFSELPALQRLIVIKCTGLTDICESVDQCVELVYIDLSYCKKLKNVPETIGRLKKVTKLLLDGCDLAELPTKKTIMDSSEVFGAKIVSLNSQKLYSIVETIPKFVVISLPSSLVRLSLAHNNLSNEAFPMDFSCLSMLKDLCLDGNPIVSLPNCVRTLPRLETLGMSNCLKLKSVEHPPCTLRQLNLYNSFWNTDYKHLLRKIAFDPEMAPLEFIADMNILAPSSFEIEGMIKIQPLVCVKPAVLCSLGWGSLFINGNKFVVTNYNYRGQKKSQIQMYYEFGIFSTIYTSMRMQGGITHISNEPSLSITIPSHYGLLKGLNFCYVLSLCEIELPIIKIKNITKKRTWIYKHYIKSVTVDGLEGLPTFLSHWMFGEKEMEVGDRITITLDMCCGDHINMCGAGFVYDERPELLAYYKSRNHTIGGDLSYYKSWNHIIGGDLSAFQLITGEYFLHSVDFLRNLFSSTFFNAHYKEKMVSFIAFSPQKSDRLGHANEHVHVNNNNRFQEPPSIKDEEMFYFDEGRRMEADIRTRVVHKVNGFEEENKLEEEWNKELDIYFQNLCSPPKYITREADYNRLKSCYDILIKRLEAKAHLST
ncbi:disease resistance protein RUN1 isoform X4 [Helianthus annuus]|uniref:disease resistance protein RUN1 isoform X4 n=1 Tax=Helianthus annuus TaxID=4232 RepID=UPI0016532157|nr:disease resistance protein RUN1 isoform X4 [Helianthus annuus]